MCKEGVLWLPATQPQRETYMSTFVAAAVESKAFSRASSNDVTAVLGEFDFMILKGEDEEPLQAPPDSAPGHHFVEIL